MSDTWKTGTPKELLAELRLGGWVQGQSGKLPRLLRLHKTDLTSDLRALPVSHLCTWKILGDPDATGRHASKRRSVVLWLGQ